MADGFKIDTSEIRQLATDFQRAGGRVGKQIAANVRKTTRAVAESAKRNVPVDTGELRDSIDYDFRGSGVSAGMAGAVFTTTPQGRFLEAGTSRMAPQPWLGPAVAEHEDAFQQNMDKIIGGALE